MLNRDDLAAACRTNDGLLAAGGNLPAVLQALNVDPQAVLYVAEQRALRLAMLHSGVTDAQLEALARSETLHIPRLHKRQRDLIPVYAGAWIDGLAVGLEAEHAARCD